MKDIEFKKQGGEVFHEDRLMQDIKMRLRLLRNGDYTVQIKRKQNLRSLPQNKLYHLWLRVIEEETGNSSSDLHELFKLKFLAPQTKVVMGEEIEAMPSTTTLSTIEFTEYLDKIKAFMADYGLHLPMPDEQGFQQMFEMYQK